MFEQQGMYLGCSVCEQGLKSFV